MPYPMPMPDQTSTRLTLDGLAVRVILQRDASGEVVLTLAGDGCDLEGEEPGTYYLRARA